ncbi:hypothetical protein V5O48_015111 [Marasmius crinis-equi]|uniref:Uncharacterized protein n=1 Tax=Marasmius crinis-equi TaxID=585013 RepID=A0ABR3EVE7_9AGAR
MCNTPAPTSEAIVANGKGKMKAQTISRRYVSLLVECGLGYPLWRPTPRRTRAGEEHIINIGDVGFAHDDLPFHTLFNITEPKDSPVNGNRVPEGVDPPCIIRPEDITMDDKSGEKDMCHIRPKQSILSENVQEDSNGSRAFKFTLTTTHGALLLLPQGSVLENLEARNEFLTRIQDHWRQWYVWIKQTKKVDLGNQQTLYIVTGVEKCSSWANASWDSAVVSENHQSLSLKLAVDGTDGRCSWAYPTSRCKTQSANPASLVAQADDILKHTIFIRGFRVDQRGGIGGSLESPPAAPMDLGGDGGDYDENIGGDGHDNDHHRGNGRQQNRSGDSPSRTTGRGSASSFGRGHSGGLSRSNFSLDFSQRDIQITDLSSFGSNSVTYPCQVINNLAFELISELAPALLDAGCIAVSHDDDWISIIRDSDEELSSEAEIIRRVFAELKYVVERDTIYASRMSDADTELLQQSLISVRNQTTLIPLLVEFREAEIESEDVIQTPTSVTMSVSQTPLSSLSGITVDKNSEKLLDSLNTEVPKPRYAVCQCIRLPHAQSFSPQMFECLIQEIDLECTVRAIALCKRTDGFQHETLIAIISLPGKTGEPEEALVLLERAGSWHGGVETYLRNSSESSSSGSSGSASGSSGSASGSSLSWSDPSDAQPPHHYRMAKDIITLLPESSLYWRYDHRSPQPPFHELPQIIKNSSTSRPLPQTFVKQSEQPDSAGANGESKGGALRLFKGLRRPQQEPSEDQPSMNSKADHAYIYAITFPEGGPDPPTVLDLAIAFKLVSEHRPEYNVAQHNCYFFAAAICKVMARKFGGKKDRNKEFHESQPPPSWHDVEASSFTDTHPQAGVYDHQWLRKGNREPIQILREDGPRFTKTVQELVTKFDDERKMHPVIKNKQREEEMRAELKGKEERIQELERRLQQLEQPSSRLHFSDPSFY